jgi:glycosyltransferase involved in cell wall biosynthesis
MKLSIGMAHHMDYDGVYFTIQSLRLHHQVHGDDFEIIVVDNSPDTRHGQLVQNLCLNWSDGITIKYVPFADAVGTTQSRERIFKEATGDAVLVMDCHVLLHPGSISRLVEHYKMVGDSKDMFTGPLMFDNLTNWTTHFDMVWRSQMWGVWSKAWTCSCGEFNFCVRDHVGECTYHRLVLEGHQVEGCDFCGSPLPKGLPFAGHEKHLVERGFRALGGSPYDSPFTIPAQGLGVFSCRKDAWVGFNENMRGFGGEEGYIHEKFRQRGGATWCLPFLRWNHRFGRAEGIRYPIEMFHKVRNYVLGFQELGLPVDDIRAHFVDSGLFPEKVWEQLVKDPINTYHEPRIQPPSKSMLPQPPGGLSLQEVFKWTESQPRDLNEHMEAIKRLAAKCDHVTEITKRRESTVAILAAKPKRVISYQSEKDTLVTHTLHQVLSQEVGDVTWTSHVGDSLEINIEETDMLFIDSIHNAERVKAELDRHGDKVNRFIVFHDVVTYGKVGDNGKEGLAYGIGEWAREHPEWFVAYLAPNQHGLLAIGRLEEDKPERPIHFWAPEKGPGTEMKKMLAKIGIHATETCSCNARAIQMDLKGCDWCEENISTIVDWLKEEADKRGLPFVKTAGKMLVRRAIKRARRQEVQS